LGTFVRIVSGASFGQAGHPHDWRMDNSAGRAEAHFQILRGGYGQRASDGRLAPAVPALLKVSLHRKDTFILQLHGGYGNTLRLTGVL